MSVTEIIPNLWIGSKSIIKDSEFKKKYNIQCVINCTRTLPLYGNQENYRIPLDDDLSKFMNELLLMYLPKTIDMIHSHLKMRKGVLVHCHAGKQRSAAVVAAYIMKWGDLNLDMAVNMIQSKRNCCFKPSINFKLALKHYEKKLQKIANSSN